MSEPLIKMPTLEDLPIDMRPSKPIVRPRFLKVRAEDIPEVLGWRVLVLPVSIPRETDSGIHLVSDTVRHMNLSKRVGTVLAIGPLAFSERRGFPDGDVPIQVGDYVQFHENSGVDAIMNGENEPVAIKYLTEVDILAKIKNPEAFMVMV